MPQTKESNLNLFESLSSVLTGFSIADIQGTGMTEKYLTILYDQVGEKTVDGLLNAYSALNIQNPEELTPDELLNVSELAEGTLFGPLTENIIYLWYLATWNPTSLFPGESKIISSKAYTNSFVYRAAGAHPMGAKQQGFGTWAYPPLTFSL